MSTANHHPDESGRPCVLILCTGNSCRSQMAEAILKNAAGDLIDVCSAGSRPSEKVHPKAIEAVREIGLDISGCCTKNANDFCNGHIHTVITVCGNADQACPSFPGMKERHHWGFEDPDEATGTEEEVMQTFRKIRDQIRLVFEAYAAGLRSGAATVKK